MKAMLLEKQGNQLILRDVKVPEPGPREILIEVKACGVCRTDLHIVDGELTSPKLPLIPGHEIAGTVLETGRDTEKFKAGERVGIPWLGRTCGECWYCLEGRENLCDRPAFTGYTIDGGYAEYACADERFCFHLPEAYSYAEAAPLLCAGLIGYRAFSSVGDARRLGLYGFGAAAHILTQIALHQGKKVYAFTRPGDVDVQQFALSLGAAWAGDSTGNPPEELDAAIIFAPVGSLVPRALGSTRKGGTVVCAGIHMSSIPGFSYELLWGERILRSIANLTRTDGEQFLKLAPLVPVRTETRLYPLEKANEALDDLRHGRLKGAAVLAISNPRK